MAVSSTSSSTSSTVSTSLLTKTGIGGLISGLDTDTLVEQLTEVTRNKIAAAQQKQQKLEWKQEIYRDIISKLSDFSDTYFSYANSSTNVLSSTFFNTSSITSSSRLLSVSGDSDAATDMVIKNISSLATSASFTSTKTVSNQAIASGTVASDWIASDLSGTSVSIEYGGESYTITLGSDFELDSNDTSTDPVDAVIAELNRQIAKTEGLSGNVSFQNINSESGTIELVTTDSGESVSLSSVSTNSNSASFLTALGFTSDQLGVSTQGSISATAIDSSLLFNGIVESGSTLEFTIDGTSYVLELSSDIDLSSYTGNAEAASQMAEKLQSLIDTDSSLSGKLTVTADESGNISFAAVSGDLEITGGSENLTNGLGLKSVDGLGNVTYSSTGSVDRSALVASYLGDELSGSTLTFTLNGVSKKITFNESEKSSFDTADELATYLQQKLDTSFGSGKVTVGISDGSLSIQTADTTSIISVTSSDNVNVLNVNGALRIAAGESNRLETTKTLEALEGEISGLSANTDGNYVFTINGKEFTFDKSTTLQSVISTINNDDDANVVISYSKTTDAFTVKSADSGAQGSISVSDTSGNLLSSLFGSEGVDYSVTSGSDAVLEVSFDGGNSFTTITRTENTFSLDDVSFTLNGLSTDPDEEITLTVESNVDDLCTKLVDFINDYNEIIDAVNTLIGEEYDSDYQPLTDEQKEEMTEDEIATWEEKAKTGLLKGDSTLRSLLSNLREAMTSVVESTGSALYQIGIATQAYDYSSGGQLVVDTDALKEALSENADVISDLFTNSDGIAKSVKSVLDKYVGTYGSDGLLISIAGKSSSATDTSSIGEKIENYEELIDRLTDQLEVEEERYWNKFTAMETALSLLEQQSTYLTSMLSS